MLIESNTLRRMATAGLFLCLAPLGAWAQDAHQPQCKDQAECDLYNAILKDNNPKTKLDKLQQWEKQYPKSDFAKVRRTFLLTTYVAAGEPKEAVAVAKQSLAEDPKDFNALYYTMLLTQQLYGASQQPSTLDDGEKAAQSLLASIDTPPAGVTADQWSKLRPDIEKLSANTLAFVDMQRKNWDGAEAKIKKALQLDPNSSSLAYWMAITQANKKNNSIALYYYARAASYDGPGALAPQGRKSVLDEVTRMYNGYHGSADGLNQLLASAKSSAAPPDGFVIKSKSEILKEKYASEAANEEKFKAEHPEWAMWKVLRQTLTGADGESYFNTNFKDSNAPPLKCKVVKLEPAIRPKTILVAMQDGSSTEDPPTTADATLKFDAPLPGKVEPGTELTFQGVPESFTASPLMVVFNIVDKDKLEGWTGKNAAPPAHRPVTKRPPAKK